MNTCSHPRPEKKKGKRRPVSKFEREIRPLVAEKFEEFKASSKSHQRIKYRWHPSSPKHPDPAVSLWVRNRRSMIVSLFPVFSIHKERRPKGPARPRSAMLAPERKAIGHLINRIQKALDVKLDRAPCRGKDLLIFTVRPK